MQDVIIPDEDKISWVDVIVEKIENGEYVAPEGNGSQKTPWKISNAYDLVYLSYRSQSNGSFIRYDNYIEFIDDIYLNDGCFDEDGTYHDGGDGKLYEWQGINNIAGLGYIYGNGYTIHGMYFNDLSQKTRGLFFSKGNIASGQLIDGLNFDNIYLNGTSSSWVYWYNIKEIKNCIVKSGNINNCNIASYCQNVSNCINYAETKKSMFDQVVTSLKNCKNYGNSTASGIICNYVKCGKVENCKNYGEAKGGLFGYTDGNNRIILNCENRGRIKCGGRTGGILGEASGSVQLINCKNFAEIDGNNCGSLIGNVYYYDRDLNLAIKNCYVENNSNPVLGFMYGAYSNYKFNITIDNCDFNFSDVKSIKGDAICAKSQYPAGGGDIHLNNVRVNLGEYSNCYLLRGHASFNIHLKNVLINVKSNVYNKLWTGAEKTDISSLIIQNVNTNRPINYFGENFLGYHFRWKDALIGLNSLDGTGLYQGYVTEDYLLNRMSN